MVIMPSFIVCSLGIVSRFENEVNNSCHTLNGIFLLIG
ncbi:hypothetical protein RICGR_0949 [Rickettsiella grylli]|uniref:Uncharacterized protein n=1 Tax=Rickettsiella grylli TaxID=59196 RepID=A8PNA1_9COXI|nr:hypothetical protein RICGR_0949 [Rickettsiella grylli]